MRLNGEQVRNDNIQVVVIPRQKRDLVFLFKPVIDQSRFEEIGPKMPKPPVIMLPGGEKRVDTDDPDYHKKVMAYVNQKNSWMFLESISATPELEWDNIDLNDSSTWDRVESELKTSEFTEQEIKLLYEGYAKANAFDDDQLEAAKNRFLAGTTQ